jgi:G3E family GTPase
MFSHLSYSSSFLTVMIVFEMHQMNRIEAAVRNINDVADIQRTRYSEVDPAWVLDIDSYYSRQLIEFANICKPCGDPTSTAAAGSTEMNGVHVATVLSSKHFKFPGKFDTSKLSHYLDDILYGQRFNTDNQAAATHAAGDDGNVDAPGKQQMIIYRMKGLLHVVNSSQLYILQAVHDIFDIYASTYEDNATAGAVIEESDVDEASKFFEDRTGGDNVIVVIGRNIDEEGILQGFRSCLVADS